MPSRHSRRVCLSEPNGSSGSHKHAAVRATCRRVGNRHRLASRGLRHPSLRRTKAAIIYKQTGNLRAVQILLGHTKIESTVRYLGVDIEDALQPAEATEV